MHVCIHDCVGLYVCMYICVYICVCMYVCVPITAQEDTKHITIHSNRTAHAPKTMLCNKLPNSIIPNKTTKNI